MLLIRQTGSRHAKKKKKFKTFKVRRHVVQKCLEWLRDHHPAYSDIEVCEDRLSQLPEDDFVEVGSKVVRGDDFELLECGSATVPYAGLDRTIGQ